MFYCENCRVRKSWPEGVAGHNLGTCEVCSQRALCWDVPSSALPESPYTDTEHVSKTGQPIETPSAPQQSDDKQGGVVLRLVPQPADATEKSRATCRRILLEMLNRVEAGEVDELVVATINNKTTPSPHYLRWHFSDPVRTVGLMYFAATEKPK